MQLLIFVLNKVDKLDAVLAELAKKNLCGATVLDSRGMARILVDKYDEGELPFLGSLRSFLHSGRRESKVILAAVQADQLPEVVDVIEGIVGDLTNEDTGVVFSVPIAYTKGICGIGK